MNPFELILPKKIVFGIGKRKEIGTLAKTLGKRAIVVCGSRTLEKQGFVREMLDALKTVGVSVLTTEIISREPEVEDVDRLVSRLHNSVLPDDFVIGFGGGAAIDLAKSVGALLPQKNNSSCVNYLEGVGTGLRLEANPLPVFAMPTTAGTGAEATKNAVIASYQPPFKKSLRDERMLPQAVLIDPELTQHCPLNVTAESGMDAVTQLIESYVSKKHQPFADALVEQALPIAVRALTILGKSLTGESSEKLSVGAQTEDDLLQARSAMSYAALLSGISLANAGLGMAHGIAPALGTHCRIPHGAACALLLPATLKTNADVCSERYAKLGRLVLNLDSSVADEAATEQLIAKIEHLCGILKLPRRLSELGVQREQIPVIAADSKGSSMSGNPKDLSTNDVIEILNGLS